jgi:hypothetical protein
MKPSCNLLALSSAAGEAYWWKRIFAAVEFDPDYGIHILCDNIGGMIVNPFENRHKYCHSVVTLRRN